MVRKTLKKIKNTYRLLSRMKKARAMKAVLAKQLKCESTKASAVIKPTKRMPKPLKKSMQVENKKSYCSDISEYHELINMIPNLLKEKKLSVFEYMSETKDMKFLSIISLFFYALMSEAQANNIKRVSRAFALKLYNKFDWLIPFQVYWLSRKKFKIALAAAGRCRKKKVIEIELYKDDIPTAAFYRTPGNQSAVLLPKVCSYYGTVKERRYLRKKLIENYIEEDFSDPQQYKKLFLAQNRNHTLDCAIKEAWKHCPESTISAYHLLEQIENYCPKRTGRAMRPYRARQSLWGFFRQSLFKASMSYRAYIAFKNGQDERAAMIYKEYGPKKDKALDEIISFYLEAVAEDLSH